MKTALQVVRRDRVQNGCTRKVRKWVGLEVCEGQCGTATLHQIVS